MNKDAEKYIDVAAKRAAREVVNLQRRIRGANLYRATERLLRAYPQFRRWATHPDEYGFFPVEKSKDISVAPPPGMGVRDRVDIAEEYIRARRTSFERTLTRFYDIDAAVAAMSERMEFVVIRMYYFNEDAAGNERDPDAGRFTFEDISDELLGIGVDRSPTTLRNWRAQMVREMTVLIFGVDGAIDVESRPAERSEQWSDTNGQKARES